MTINTENNEVIYQGPGQVFSYPYAVFQDAELAVTIQFGPQNTIINPALNGSGTYDYTISGAFDNESQRYPDGVTVTLNTSLPDSTYRIALQNRPRLVQNSDYQNGGPLPAEQLETDLDRLTVALQSVRSGLSFTGGGGGSGGVTDHGQLTGLADDDHVQYLLANGTRRITGGLAVGLPTGGIPATGFVNAKGYLIDGIPIPDGGGSGTVTGIITVSSRSALKALDTTETQAAYLVSLGQARLFLFRSGDFSAHIALDTKEGIYIKADAIATTSGAWVAAEFEATGVANIDWFGAPKDNSGNAGPAGTAAALLTGKLKLSANATYLCTSPITLDYSSFSGDIANSPANNGRVVIDGEGVDTVVRSNGGPGTHAIDVTGGTSGPGGFHGYDRIGNFAMRGPRHGIRINSKAYTKLDNLTIAGCETGISLISSLTSVIENCHVVSGVTGIYMAEAGGISGVNAIKIKNCVIGDNSGVGLFVEDLATQLSIHGCTVENNGTGAGATRGGIIFQTDGSQGDVGLNISDTYFEGNKGAADILIQNNGTRDIVVNIRGCNFNRVDDRFCTNVIKTQNISTGRIFLNVEGCAFSTYGTYTPSAGRQFINPGAGTVLNVEGCAFSNTTEAATVGGSGSLGNQVTLSGTSPNIIFDETDTSNTNFQVINNNGTFRINSIDDVGGFVNPGLLIRHNGGASLGGPTGGLPATLGVLNTQGLQVNGQEVHAGPRTFAGRVGGAGTAQSLPSGWSSTLLGQGSYRITHNLGTDAYTFVGTSQTVGTSVASFTRSTNTVDIATVATTDGTALNGGFGFILALD